MKQISLAVLLFIIGPFSSAAEKEFDPQARARAIAPFLDEQTIGIYHVDLTRLDVDAILAKSEKIHKVLADELKRGQHVLKHWTGGLTKAGVRELYLVFSLADLPQHPPFAIVPLPDEADIEAVLKLFGKGKAAETRFLIPFEVHDRIGNVIFVGSKAARERLRTMKPASRPDLAKAFSALGDTAVQAILVPGADIRKIIEETIPVLPKEIGGGSSSVITRGVQWAGIGANPPPDLSFHLVIESHDPESAKKLHELLDNGLRNLGASKEVQAFLPMIGKMITKLSPEVKDERLTLSLDGATLMSMVVPGLLRARSAAERTMSINNLKQIGLAMHNYHDVNKGFPGQANYDKNGKPLLSWRVHILPYLEQDQLYKQFHLDEPWDSANNRKLIPQMPAIYRSKQEGRLGPLRIDNGKASKTTYVGVVGPNTMFPGIPGKNLTFMDITDGTSNTIFVVDANDERAVVWSKPEDLPFNPSDPWAGLLGHYPDGFLALFVDGSVRVMPAKTDAKLIGALFTRNGGELIPQQ